MKWKLGAASILSLIIGIHYDINFLMVIGAILGAIVLFMIYNPAPDDIDDFDD